MKKHKKIDCLGLGIAPYDILFGVDRYPEAEMKIDALNLFMQGGGPVPSVLIGLSRLGYRTSLIAAFGNDLIGKQGIAEIMKEGVKTDLVVWKNKPSALAAGWVENKTGRRTLVLAREALVSASDIVTGKLPNPSVIHLDGRDMEATMKLAKWGKKNGAIISFDIGSIRNDVSAVFKYVDHLVVADSYAFAFTRTKDAKKAIMKLKKLCPETVVVTEGIKGSVGIEDGKFITQEAFKVKTVDTTGAGDAFHTGYLYGLLNGFDLAERLKYGSAVAAMKCRSQGARSGLPTRKELTAFMKKLIIRKQFV